MNKLEMAVGIGGGVGPMAGVELHKLIIQQTNPSGVDQGHLTVIHVSDSPSIPDRTKYLLGEVKDDPAEAMLHVMQMIEAAAKVVGKDVVAGVPCNTFHAPEIWNRFMGMLEANGVKIQVLHMLNETAKLIKEVLPDARAIGLMSTTGTRKVGVYRKILEPMGYSILEVPEEVQNELHDSIYNQEWGIKAVSPVTPQASANFRRYAGMLREQGAEAIILGCTEIPLALPEPAYEGVPLVDPMFALARALVREANPDKLVPLHR